VSDGTIEHLRHLIDGLRRNEDGARRAIMERVCNRLRRLAAHILSASFADMAGRHQLDSVVHETWLRLAQALETTQPASVEHFFRLAAQKVRHVLLDMVQSHRRQRSHEALGLSDGSRAPTMAGGQTHDPQRLALWTEFHEKVAGLPDDERTVFEMHYYLELPQAEIAEVLGLHPRQVSRLWIRSTDKLADGLADLGGP
jgi:RNA polymerase sigma factor (sigma-70 family)